MPREDTLATLAAALDDETQGPQAVKADFPESPRLDMLSLVRFLVLSYWRLESYSSSSHKQDDEGDSPSESETMSDLDEIKGFDTDAPQFFFLSPESSDEEIPDIPEDVNILDYDGFQSELRVMQDTVWGAEQDEKILNWMMLFLDTLQEYRKPEASGFSVDAGAQLFVTVGMCWLTIFRSRQSLRVTAKNSWSS